MGGMNPADRIKATGIDMKKDTLIKVLPTEVHVLERGHLLFDLRSELPLDPVFVESLASGDVAPEVVVRDNGIGKDGKADLQVIDGTRRTLHSLAANARRAEEGKLPLRLRLSFVTGDDAQMLRLRLRLNGGNRKAETAATLAHKLGQGASFGLTPEEMAAESGTELSLVHNLLRFPNLIREVQLAFDEGPAPLPLGALAAFLDVPRDEQSEVLRAVRADGADTPRKIAKAVKAKRGIVGKARPMTSQRLFGFADRCAEAGHKSATALLCYAAGDLNALDAYPDLLALAAEPKKEPKQKPSTQPALV